MNRTDILYAQLGKLVEKLNHELGKSLKLNQQAKVKEHMSLTGANGRLYVTPAPDGYDVSLSGVSLEKQMAPILKDLFGRGCDGYKQKNSNTGIDRQPYWRTTDFKRVEEVCVLYAKTKK